MHSSRQIASCCALNISIIFPLLWCTHLSGLKPHYTMPYCAPAPSVCWRWGPWIRQAHRTNNLQVRNHLKKTVPIPGSTLVRDCYDFIPCLRRFLIKKLIESPPGIYNLHVHSIFVLSATTQDMQIHATHLGEKFWEIASRARGFLQNHNYIKIEKGENLDAFGRWTQNLVRRIQLPLEGSWGIVYPQFAEGTCLTSPCWCGRSTSWSWRGTRFCLKAKSPAVSHIGTVLSWAQDARR